jgi:Putative prokaryotic signal transducing protein
MAEANEGKATKRPTGIVELTRVQPFEAEVIVARLRDSGIAATVGPESVYESLSFAGGVPVLVPEGDLDQALALLNEGDRPE